MTDDLAILIITCIPFVALSPGDFFCIFPFECVLVNIVFFLDFVWIGNEECEKFKSVICLPIGLFFSGVMEDVQKKFAGIISSFPLVGEFPLSTITAFCDIFVGSLINCFFSLLNLFSV